MKQFIALYFLFLVILFVFFYAPTSILSIAVNYAQTNITLFALDIFLKPKQLEGIDIWINPHYKIIISQACNGIIPILFLWASILAYPSTWQHKIFWMLLGYVVFFIVNIIRILLVVYVTQEGEGKNEFHWSHDLVGNSLLMITGLILFVSFIRSSSRESKSFES
jgi:exosortase/archaeosortase family protein